MGRRDGPTNEERGLVIRRGVVISRLPYCKRVSIIASANCDSISYNQRKDPGTSFQSESFCFKLKEIGFLFSSFDVTKNLAPLAFLISVNSKVLVSFPTAICLLNLSTCLVFMIGDEFKSPVTGAFKFSTCSCYSYCYYYNHRRHCCGQDDLL